MPERAGTPGLGRGEAGCRSSWRCSASAIKLALKQRRLPTIEGVAVQERRAWVSPVRKPLLVLVAIAVESLCRTPGMVMVVWRSLRARCSVPLASPHVCPRSRVWHCSRSAECRWRCCCQQAWASPAPRARRRCRCRAVLPKPESERLHVKVAIRAFDFAADPVLLAGNRTCITRGVGLVTHMCRGDPPRHLRLRHAVVARQSRRRDRDPRRLLLWEALQASASEAPGLRRRQ